MGGVVMELGFVGLGRMGGNMVRRLQAGGHHCHIFSQSAETREMLAAETGAVAVADLAALVASLVAPRTIWVMVPEGAATEAVLSELRGLCAPGDVVIDGGNSHFKQTVARGMALAEDGIHLVVEKLDKNRIESVHLYLPEPKPEDEEGDED